MDRLFLIVLYSTFHGLWPFLSTPLVSPSVPSIRELWDIVVAQKFTSMFSFVVTFLILISAFLFSYVRTLVRSYRSRLGDIGGPLPARFTRMWKLWEIYKGSFEKTNINLHESHGQIVRIAPNLFSISDPQAGKSILRDPRYKKSEWYSAAAQPGSKYQNIFSQRVPEKHSVMRRQINPVFTEKALQDMEQEMDECIAEFCELLAQAADDQSTVDLFSEVQHLLFNVTTKIGMNKRVEPSSIMRTIRGNITYLAFVGTIPEWHRLLFWLKDIASFVWSFGREPGSVISGFIDREIGERLGNPLADRNDVLSRLLALHNEDPVKYPIAAVQNGCFSLIVPGFDTVAITCSKISDELCRRPHMMARLRREIDQYVTSDGRTWTLPSVQLKKMVYLDAVIQESLRIHPAVGLPLERIVPEGGATIAGRYFPSKTVVGINAWVLNRDKGIFGEDAGNFRPERWLESEARAEQMKGHLFSWGDGSRVCIGRPLAVAAMQKVAACLAQHFALSLENPEQEWETTNYQFVRPKTFLVTVSKRSCEK